MTREEQIIEAGKIAAEGKEFSVLVNRQHRTMSAYEIGFIEGAQWADSHPHWISIEEELPKEGQVVLINTKGGSVSTACYTDGRFDITELFQAINVTHWMPIVPPRKEE